MKENEKTVSELLHSLLDDKSTIPSSCSVCSKLFGAEIYDCGGHVCSDIWYALSDRVDAELEAARSGFTLDAWRGGAELRGWPTPRDVESLGDYIDRCFLPRPRFEDGEPIANGAETAEGAIAGWCVYNDGTYIVHGEDGDTLYDENASVRVKRPAPKVYDADGVEIKVGDIVWLTLQDTPGDDKQFTVFNIGNAGEVIVAPKCGINRSYSATLLTHERPVFDAEGVRICKGDTVWHANHQWIVVGIVYHEGKPWVQIDNTDGKASAQERQPFGITHREPDSLEKLRDDMRSFGEVGADCTSDCCLDYADRLTALIERCA